jgi:hypothetical protein
VSHVKVGRGDKHLTTEHNTDYKDVGVTGCDDDGGCEGDGSLKYYFGCWLTPITIFRIISLVRRNCQHAASGR